MKFFHGSKQKINFTSGMYACITRINLFSHTEMEINNVR